MGKVLCCRLGLLDFSFHAGLFVDALIWGREGPQMAKGAISKMMKWVSIALDCASFVGRRGVFTIFVAKGPQKKRMFGAKVAHGTLCKYSFVSVHFYVCLSVCVPEGLQTTLAN